MNQSEIYSLALAVGLSDSAAKTAAAIAMAESGGNPNAHNDNAATGDDSYGLWQINMRGSLGPARRTQFGISNNGELYTPTVNAKAMKTLSQSGRVWTPWTTYTRGTYRSYLANPVTKQNLPADVAAGIAGGIGGALTAGTGQLLAFPQDILDAFHKISTGLEKTTNWVSNQRNWVRVAYVIGGGIMVYAAIETLILPYSTRAVSTVMGATKKIGV